MSINEPEVVTVTPAITASIRDVVAVDDLAIFFDTSFSTIAGVIAAQGVTVTGLASRSSTTTRPRRPTSRSGSRPTGRSTPPAA
jgi:hypothetical protein